MTRSVRIPQSLLAGLSGYVLGEQLYWDAKTAVYRAIQTSRQRSVLVKVLCHDYPSLSELVQFRSQYEITKGLPLSGIVQPLSLERLGNGYALIMEDWGGIDLEQYRQQQSLTLPDVLKIAVQLADILHGLYQHRVVHKDIKPANILIHPASKQVKLIDFSIASLLPKETQAIQNPRYLEGTLAYLAPEQTGRMNRGIDYRADFYALGITLYQLLSGRLPFVSDDPMEVIYSHIAKVPMPVDQVASDIPEVVSAIVSKLLAKNAEDRYQSALGLKHDLEQCLVQWQAQGEIVDFGLGRRDISDRFLIPEKLYGRETEIQTLLDAFERVAQGGLELILVEGYSGLGKTAVINEVHKPITRRHGYFIKGKFDQFNCNIPFSAFVQAFRSLMGQLLGESDAALVQWKNRILEVVGDSGQVLIDVIPELERIIGSQSPVPDLSGIAAQNRFNLLFRKFIQVFTTPEHPLVIFLDDLQWVDSASLNLLRLLMEKSDAGLQASYLMVLGAYRDNEIFPAHPLMLMLADVQKQEVSLQTLTLEPLTAVDINQLVADTLFCTPERAVPLSEWVYQTAQGNPFFTIQFLQGLYGDGYIHFDAVSGYWQFDLTSVRELALADDVVTFMVKRLRTLPEATQDVLKNAACIGNQFDLALLSAVCEQSQSEVATDLWPSLQLGLVLPYSETYKFFQETNVEHQSEADPDVIVSYNFLHDRVQQAAYSLIPAEEKQANHVRIGQRLLAKITDLDRSQCIFKVVNNFNHGIDLIKDIDLRQQLAQLNFEAGKVAKSSLAYIEAVSYLEIGLQLLSEQGWETQYDLTRSLHSELVNVHYLRGDFEAVDTISSTALGHIQDITDAAPFYIAKIASDQAQGKMLTGLDLGLRVLAQLGIQIHQDISDSDVQETLHQTLSDLQSRTVDDFVTLPQSDDLRLLRTQELLTLMVGYAFKSQPKLLPLIICEQIKLLLKHGNIPSAASIYALFGMLLCGLQEFEAGHFAGEVALAVMAAFPTQQYEMRVRNLIYSYINPWKAVLKDCIPALKKGFTVGLEAGDIEYTAYGIHHYCQFLYFSGADLVTAEQEFRTYSQILGTYRQEGVLGGVQVFHQTVLNLMVVSDRPWDLEGEIFQESKCLHQWMQNHFDVFVGTLFINKLVLSYLFNQPALGLRFAADANVYFSRLTGEFHLCYLFLYRALSRLALLELASSEEQENVLLEVAQDLGILERFSSHAPMNFQHQVDLIKAERCRVCDQKLDAIENYDRAIAGAKENGYIQEEAVANELAAKFYLEWGKEKIASTYLQESYHCYARWGANAKVQDLIHRYPQLLQPVLPTSLPTSTASSSLLQMLSTIAPTHLSLHSTIAGLSFTAPGLNSNLDFAAILKSAQAIADTLQLDDLLQQLSELMLQTSGADCCLLVLPDNGNWQLRVKANTTAIEHCGEPLEDSAHVPRRLVHYVKNTCEVVAIDDVATDAPTDLWVDDAFWDYHKPRSLLCLPLIYRDSVVGVLYLHNQSTSGVFTCDRITVTSFLCTQAAIALENARLFAEQLAAESSLRLSQEQLQKTANHLPGVIYQLKRDVDGHLSFPYISDRSQDLFGFSSSVIQQDAELLLQCIEPVDRESFLSQLYPSTASLTSFIWIGCLTLPTGQQKWIEVRSTPALQDDGICLWNGVILDITERKQTEADLQLSEARANAGFEQVALGIVESDMKTGAMVRINSYFCDLLGYTCSELKQMSVADFTHPDDMPESRRLTQALYQGEIEDFTLEKRYIHKDGSEIWSLTTVTLVAMPNSHSQYCWAMVQDIRDRKTAEATIQRQLQRERLLAEITNEIRQNLDTASIFQTTVEVVGQAFQVNRCVIYTYQTHPKGHTLVMAEYAQDVSPLRDLVFTLDPTSYLQCVAEFGPITTSHIPIMAEISEGADSQTVCNGGKNKSPLQEVVMVVDKNVHTQRVLAQDRAVATADVYTDPLLMPMLPLAQTADTRALLSVRTSYQGQANGIISLHQAHYCREWTLDDINLLESVAAQVGIALAQAGFLEQEKTQRRDLEIAKDSAESANTAKNQFLANMSHELRTPLNSILGFSELMRQDPSISQRQRENLDIINRSGNHLLFLINDILEMSKIEAGHTALELNTVDLYQFIDELRQMLQLKAKKKGIDLRFNHGADVPQYILVDEGKLRQTLLNLLDNAIKFTQMGTISLTIDLHSLASQTTECSDALGLRFTVTDSGPGIRPEETDFIFKPFCQGSAGTATQKGSGLGLAISQKFAQLMGGQITLVSDIGKGSSFYCDIFVEPLTALETEEVFKHRKHQSQILGIVSSQSAYRLLVVDDNDDNRLLLCQLLSIPGFDVRDVRDGQQALDINAVWHPDLILMDIRMPGLDGLEVTRRIRTSQDKYIPKIIAQTANAYPEDRHSALAVGCDDFISKPCSPHQILDRVARLLNIEFSYATEEPSVVSPFDVQTAVSLDLNTAIQAGFNAMPADWQEQFIQETMALRNERIIARLADVPDQYQPMKDAIIDLVDKFRYDTILDALGVLSQRSTRIND